MTSMFFTLDSSAKFIISRRLWNFASASDEIFEQKLFQFSLQRHHCSQWEISKQLYWSVFWYDETESWKGTVFHWSRCYVEFWSIVWLSLCVLLPSLYFSSEIQLKKTSKKWGKSLYMQLVYFSVYSRNIITVNSMIRYWVWIED